MRWLLGVITGFVVWTVLFLAGNAWVARAVPGATDTDGVIVSATAASLPADGMTTSMRESCHWALAK